RHTRWPRDWSSDVCSSDLAGAPRARRTRGAAVAPHAAERLRVSHPLSARRRRLPRAYPRLGEAAGRALRGLSSLARARLRKGLEIGRASCRERGEVREVAV